MSVSTRLCAKHALTSAGWQSDVVIDIDETGRITDVRENQSIDDTAVDILIPAMSNLHSHAFQRAMAGMTEMRGPDKTDSFWSWRKLMYGFLQHLNPDDAESIAAFGQMEMLESGYTSVGEFHYLHHQPNGDTYSNLAEMSERIIAAATQTGIGLTLLPVLYEQGGCDGRELLGGQKRFGNAIDRYHNLFIDAQVLINEQPGMSIGIAPHSLRAVSSSSLMEAHTLAEGKPFHIHVAEQDAEVDEVISELNARPVRWLLDNMPVNEQWCLIHATQMLPDETNALAQSGATVGLCPVTESNLGDGVFDGSRYQKQNGQWGIGTDSNINISLSEELRTLEYSQRLTEKGRAVYADKMRSTARLMYDSALAGGAGALQRKTGAIAAGHDADLLALYATSASMVAVSRDGWLDAWIFANNDGLVRDVWARGRHLVANGKHIQREDIETRYKITLSSLSLKL